MTYEYLGVDPTLIGAGMSLVNTAANLYGQYQQLKAMRETSRNEVEIKRIEFQMKEIDKELARMGYSEASGKTASLGSGAKTAAIVGGGALAALALMNA